MDRVLVVEDDPTNLMVIARRLRHAGYAVDEATDGKNGLELLQRHSGYMVVVGDRNMPVMDGLQLFAEMKKDPKLRSIPFIMQTGSTEPERVAEGIKAGVYYYLAKPFEEEVLVTLVRTAIRERQNFETFEAQLSRHREALRSIKKGEFSLSTPQEAQNLALMIGSLFLRPELATSGLYEILLNAIEHGNLGIGFEGKSKLLTQGTWEEEVATRLSKPENLAKRVTVQLTREKNHIEVHVTDMGAGFNWQPYLSIEPGRATRANGRGVAKANMLCFDKVTYQGNGNSVQIKADGIAA